MEVRRDFRFGVNLLGRGSASEFLEQVRHAERCGIDVVLLPDHLELGAPFPMLAAAAAAAPTVRVGNFVLNAGFYRPALLARDIASVDQLTGGRFEIGLGAGYVEAEFEAVGLPFESAGRRVDHLKDTVLQLKALLSDPGFVPPVIQSPPPIMIAGTGNKVLTLAAQHADIVALAVLADDEALAERVDFLRKQAGERFDQLEINLIIADLAIDREPDLQTLRSHRPDVSDSALLRLPNALHGTHDEVVARIRELRDTFGVTYLTPIEPSAADLDAYGRVIGELRSGT
ncbi:TIGR03621 family F420-dependent LLM class oxidoreductase [Gordonia rubripertincta]|uniref:TIGR03621 family F420-dependent LLM class oxidoreductase n=1 Tax=Gordonia rubripertincta TaxID=36822 RepID=A0ABT4MSC1_GORRU|nr:TIGR03621 family F420-dependent LLM class oxidoreductase [Gordonia rubripertincta]MCZ4549929.1 TIGR03621 family F420-dependent LLM class oxidoreductase [Gordonia rubripertincta]